MKKTRLPIAAVLAGIAVVLAPASAQEPVDEAAIAAIRTEGMERSEVSATFYSLTDVLGPRLTGSPAHGEAARWARDKFRDWGLANPRLEAFDFGRGWSLEKLTTEMTAPRYMPLTGYAEAWSPPTSGLLAGTPIYLGDSSIEEIDRLGRRLRGAIVLTHRPQTEFLDTDRPQPALDDAPVQTGNPPFPSPGSRTTPDEAVASLVLAAEQYNMRVRLAQGGTPLELAVEIGASFHADLETYNVLAEIPGSDPLLRDEIVFVGAHLDSWHTATGATDNADGVTAVMEAMRILATLDARPRRTIRVALWGGEEQGLLGARAYVERHLVDEAARARITVYLNDDPGSGATYGFYMQRNDAAKRIFDAWLEPLRDLRVRRNVIEGIDATDHVPFDEIGIPAFTVIKDFRNYDVRTRHTNADLADAVDVDDLKQSAVVLAAVVWLAATSDEPIPRRSEQ